jgi:hypothetical protein
MYSSYHVWLYLYLFFSLICWCQRSRFLDLHVTEHKIAKVFPICEQVCVLRFLIFNLVEVICFLKYKQISLNDVA